MKKILKIFIILDIFLILLIFLFRIIFLDYPVILLLIALIWYWKLNNKLVRIKTFLKKHSILTIILGLSFLVRFLGIFYPEHYGLVEQEIYTLPIVASFSGKWLETFNQFSSFETLGLFIQGTFFNLTTYFDFKLFINFFHFLFPQHYYFLNIPSPDVHHWPSWSPDGTYSGLSPYLVDRYALNYFLVRLVSVMMGTATIVLVYFSAKNLFGKTVALFSSLVLGFTFLHVVMSTIGREYAISIFFVTLVFLFACYILKKGNIYSYLFCGVAIGLVGAVKVFPASIFPLLTAFILDSFYNKEKKESYSKNLFKKLPYLIFAFIAALFTFLVFSPRLFLDFETFSSGTSNVLSHFLGNPWGMNYYSAKVGLPSWLWWTKFMAGSGLYYPLFLATILGMGIAFYKAVFRFNKESILLLSAILPYLYLINISASRREEFIVFITPFLAILAGIFITQVVGLIRNTTYYSAKSKNIILIGALFLLIGIPILRIFLFDYSINTADNRTKVAEWINKKAQEGDYIYFIGPYTQKIMVSPDKYLISGEDLLRQDFDYYLNTRIDYIVVPAIRNFGQFVYHPKEYQNILNNFKLMHYGQLEAEFYKPFFEDGFFSPVITLGDLVNEHFDGPLQIYKLKKDIPDLSNALEMNPDFISNPPAPVYRTLDKFETIDDKQSNSKKNLFTRQKEAQLSIMPRFGRGKYQVIFQIKTNVNWDSNEIVLIRMGSNIGQKDYGVYYIKGIDFQFPKQYQDFTYSVDFSKASRLSLDLITLSDHDIYLESIIVKKVE